MERKIPRADGPFHSFINTSADYLAEGAPTNAIRLGLLPPELAEWDSRRDNWNLIYAKHGDESKRTKTITAEKDDQKKAFMLFATPLLKGMALKPALTNDDRGALNLPERDAPTDRVKITTAPLAKIIPMEGGELSIRVRTTSDNNRASRHPDADHVEMRYALVDATAASSGSSGGSGSNPSTGSGNQNSIPTKAMDCIFTESSKKAVFTVELGQENSGKRIYAFFRWVNTSKRSDSGPWSTAVQSVVV